MAPDPLLEAAQAVLDEVAAACPHIALPAVRRDLRAAAQRLGEAMDTRRSPAASHPG